MNKAVAYKNNSVVFLAWQYDAPISNCLGFDVRRTDLKTKKITHLQTWVPFQGQTNTAWKPQGSDIWPVQKFSWRDFSTKSGGSYQYEIVPMVGVPGDLSPQESLAVTTNPVNLSTNYGDISAAFTNGVLSTQFVAHQLPPGKDGSPSLDTLTEDIKTAGNPLRKKLAGDSLPMLMSLLKRAKKSGGQCYCALYELNDPNLVQLLMGNKAVHVILSNTGADDATNQQSRQALHQSGVDIHDRMLTGDHIGHNKFAVYVDKTGKPRAVLSGSTNWTPNGMCAQSNNAVIIESPEVASAYLDYWHRLLEDDAKQGQPLRTSDMKSCQFRLDSGKTELTTWFSPNTKASAKPAKNPPTPPDMDEVFKIIRSAKQTVLFLVFLPGTPSIVDEALAAQEANPKLLVRGAVSDSKAMPRVKLIHRPGEDPTVVLATAINDTFAAWHKELLKAGYAIIHDKIVVVDPFSPDCAVITGSHNLGYKASYSNDENLLIIRGNQDLAQAYAVHVLDIYDHYRFRYMRQQQGKAGAFSGFLCNDPSWQEPYFTTSGRVEMQNWIAP